MDISIESKTLHPRWRGFLTSPSHAYRVQLILKSTIVTILTLFTMVITPSKLLAEGAEKMNPKKIIFETDMSTDVDDVGALQVRHPPNPLRRRNNRFPDANVGVPRGVGTETRHRCSSARR